MGWQPRPFTLSAGVVTRSNLASGIFTQLFEAATSPSAADTWENWDLSAVAATGAKFVVVVMVGAGATTAGVRPDGSALVPTYVIANGDWRLLVVELPSTRIVERFVATVATRATFAVVGYL